MQDGKRQRLAERKFSFCEAESLPRVATPRQPPPAHLPPNRPLLPRKPSQKRFPRRRGHCGKENLFSDGFPWLPRAASPQLQPSLSTLSRKFPSASLGSS